MNLLEPKIIWLWCTRQITLKNRCGVITQNTEEHMKNRVTILSMSVAAFSLYLLFTSGMLPGKGVNMTISSTPACYCEYCGKKFASVRQLTSATCVRHPDGPNKGRHKLYEGTEKSEYTCKYCGKKFPSIQVMTGGQCVHHPKGENKGHHSPAL